MIARFILFIVSLILVSVSAGKQLKMLRLTNYIEKILAFILLAVANIVLCTYILSEFSGISALGYLIIQTFFANFLMVIFNSEIAAKILSSMGI